VCRSLQEPTRRRSAEWSLQEPDARPSLPAVTTESPKFLGGPPQGSLSGAGIQLGPKALSWGGAGLKVPASETPEPEPRVRSPLGCLENLDSKRASGGHIYALLHHYPLSSIQGRKGFAANWPGEEDKYNTPVERRPGPRADGAAALLPGVLAALFFHYSRSLAALLAFLLKSLSRWTDTFAYTLAQFQATPGPGALTRSPELPNPEGPTPQASGSQRLASGSSLVKRFRTVFPTLSRKKSQDWDPTRLEFFGCGGQRRVSWRRRSLLRDGAAVETMAGGLPRAARLPPTRCSVARIVFGTPHCSHTVYVAAENRVGANLPSTHPEFRVCGLNQCKVKRERVCAHCCPGCLPFPTLRLGLWASAARGSFTRKRAFRDSQA
ncbi:hypothetical protein EI555_011570, partial [Monodon monoceros]